MKLQRYVIILMMALFSQNARADIILPDIFSDHMVLQQKAKIELWGWASPAEPVSITSSFSNRKIEVVADSSGQWKVEIRTPAAGGPYELIITGYSRKVLQDVWLGEVWLASGQSNMEMPIDSIAAHYSGVLDYKQEIEQADYPMIRQFDVQNHYAYDPEFNAIGQWEIIKPQNAGNFSATAYFFARELRQKLDVPVGIINATWGGTPAQAWIKGEALNPFQPYFSQVEALIQDNEAPIDKNYPSVLYNGMISPVIPYSIQGVIWYQGESNIGKPEEYEDLMKVLINNWRNQWDARKLPFLMVQIAPYDYASRNWFKGDAYSLGRLIEAQQSVLDMRNVYLAPTSDIGNLKDIHPKNKQEVGKRLANIALDEVYKQKVDVISGPVFHKMKIKEGKVILSFKETGSGIMFSGDKLEGFEIAGPDQKFYPAQASLDKKNVVLSSEMVEQPVAVRYAFKNTSQVNFFNQEGWPARPFRTDDW